MSDKTIRFLFLGLLLIGAGLACQTVNQAREQIGEAQGTVQSVATDVQEGRELIGTIEGVATQVLGNQVFQTAQAFVTEQGPALQGTLEAVATNQLPGWEATLEAFATEQGPAIEQTAQAFITEGAPGLAATAQALATDVANVEPGEGPQNVPRTPGEVEVLHATSDTLSYTTAMAFDSVVDFYKTEMPALGWTPQETGNVEMPAIAVLLYENPEQTASITITPNPVDNTVVVLLVVDQK